MKNGKETEDFFLLPYPNRRVMLRIEDFLLR